jgi:hypothetical protein
MHNIFLEWEGEDEDFQKALTTIRSRGLTLTSAFFACICSAITQVYYHENRNGEADGAHLLFSANARRWLPSEGANDTAPITMAGFPGGAWVDATIQEMKATSLETMSELARKIRQAQKVDLGSPHILALLDDVATSVTEGELLLQSDGSDGQ